MSRRCSVGWDGQTDTVKDNQCQGDAVLGGMDRRTESTAEKGQQRVGWRAGHSQGDGTGWVGQTDGRGGW